ncbi:hypothetical protein SAMN06295926_12242 [Lysinibacillus sp. AC-3]|nr:hypothetical protein SAMN06295926_12242 [Lysinibacillus sp. AC-3]
MIFSGVLFINAMTHSTDRFLSGPVQFLTHLSSFRSYSRHLEVSTYRCGFSFRCFDGSIHDFDCSIHDFGCSIHDFGCSILHHGSSLLHPSSSFRHPNFFPSPQLFFPYLDNRAAVLLFTLSI